MLIKMLKQTLVELSSGEKQSSKIDSIVDVDETNAKFLIGMKRAEHYFPPKKKARRKARVNK